MSFRVEREAAQRARRPPGVDDVEGALGEGPGLRAGETDPEHGRAVLLVLEEPFLGLGQVLLGLGVQLHEGLRLDDHALVLAVPGQCHGAHAELLLDGGVEGRRVGGSGGCGGGDGGAAAAAPHDFVQKLVHALGEGGDLGLLQGHAGHPGAGGGLEEERTAPGQSDRTGHETFRLVVEEHLTGHVLSPWESGKAEDRDRGHCRDRFTLLRRTITVRPHHPRPGLRHRTAPRAARGRRSPRCRRGGRGTDAAGCSGSR